ncbi:L-cysteine desulfidase family protein [Methanocella arvoryzae]|nr:L-serine ammonia-lyase, iron-sulfur-dependent, subunit alpha [Methanocella arvoryzae]
MDKRILLRALESEIERTTGCTDPGAVCLAVRAAAIELGVDPEKIVVTVSPNIYKNGINVGVPGTGMRGLHIAAGLGAVIKSTSSGLALLDAVDPADVERAVQLVNNGRVTITHAETTSALYIKAEVFSGAHYAHAVIRDDYTSIVEVGLDGKKVSSPRGMPVKTKHESLKGYTLEELFTSIDTMTVEELTFLRDAAEVNRKAAEAGLESGPCPLGKALYSGLAGAGVRHMAAARAQALTAAACEARMSGMQVPIIAIAGSGNHGIASFLGILAVAETLASPEEKLLKALAISSTVTVAIKEHSTKLSAFCGCAVAASTGVAAGTVYLLGGSYEEITHAMQSVIGTLAGMVCDGAKESCAFKLSSSVALAIQFGHLSLEDAYIKEGMGIVSQSIEKTFENLGRLNNPGMVTADKLMLQMISGH